MLTRALSYLLWLANSNPPITGRREFYAVKDRILRRWGNRDTKRDHDWQRIHRECWTCNGTGIYEDTGRTCRRCGGSGIYETVYVKLERWRLGGRVFHRPSGRRYSRPDKECVIIPGRILHAETVRAGREAGLWLMLLFAPRDWWRQMTASCNCHPGAWPMLRLQWAMFGLRMAVRGPRRNTCTRCGRRFGWPTRRPSWARCPGCGEANAEKPEDIPF